MNNEAPFYGDQIQGDRDYQEDTYRIEVLGDEKLFILCDGMGGHVAGKQASSLAVEEFIQGFSQHSSLPIKQRLREGLMSANAGIEREINHSDELKGMGTTLLAVYLSAESLHWVSVGDSPLWLIRNENIQRLNADHSMAEVFRKLVSLGEISEQDAINDPKRHALLSSVSGDKIKYIDLPETPFEMLSGDCLLLASDGMESLPDKDIIRLVASQANPKDGVAKLLGGVKASNKPQQDNATVIVYRHGQSPEKLKGATFSPLKLFSWFLITTLLIAVIFAVFML
jgi:protein phosphatase